MLYNQYLSKRIHLQLSTRKKKNRKCKTNLSALNSAVHKNFILNFAILNIWKTIHILRF